MLFIMLAALSTKEDTHPWTTGKVKICLRTVCWSACGVATWAYLFGGHYGLFVTTFTTLVIVDALLFIVIAWWPQAPAAGYHDEPSMLIAKAAFLVYAFAFITARVFWEMEVHFCVHNSGDPLHWFHVIWHALTGFAIYIGCLCLAQLRYATLGIGRSITDPEHLWPLMGIVTWAAAHLEVDASLSEKAEAAVLEPASSAAPPPAAISNADSSHVQAPTPAAMSLSDSKRPVETTMPAGEAPWAARKRHRGAEDRGHEATHKVTPDHHVTEILSDSD
jgi:hypothetical protein